MTSRRTRPNLMSRLFAALVLASFGIVAAVEHGHEDTEALMHLRAGQADPAVLVHGVDHVVDEFLEARVLDLGALERAGLLPQHRMPHARDLQDGHAASTTDWPAAVHRAAPGPGRRWRDGQAGVDSRPVRPGRMAEDAS